MPITYHIDQAQRMVFTTASGIVSAMELIAIQAQLRTDPAFDSRFHELADISALDGLAGPIETLHYLAAVRLYRPGTPRAIVATTERSFASAEQFLQLAARYGEHFQVFRERAAALAWLESNPEPPEPNTEPQA